MRIKSLIILAYTVKLDSQGLTREIGSFLKAKFVPLKMEYEPNNLEGWFNS